MLKPALFILDLNLHLQKSCQKDLEVASVTLCDA